MTDAPAPDLVLHGERVRLRRLRDTDRSRMREILGDPEVRRWWGSEPLEKDVEDLFDDDAVGFAIELDDGVVGWIQYAEENEPDYRHAGIDLAIGDGSRGRAIGPDAIRAMARYLFEERGHHRITIDPSAANERAIRAYESVGFKRVGVMRRYERGPDGVFHDGLLLDLLRGEIIP